MPSLRLKPYTLLILLLAPATLLAELSLPHFFSNNMVLQRDREVSIWGKADPGANVTVNFKGRQVNVWAKTDGNWNAVIDSGPADSNGANLSVSNGQERTTLAIHFTNALRFFRNIKRIGRLHLHPIRQLK